MSETIDAIKQIEQDFEKRNEPFDDVVFPEERLIEESAIIAGNSDEPLNLSDEDKLRLVSMFSTFDYNRDANQLVDNILALQQREPKVFDAWKVDTLALDTIFADIGFRYPNRDAQAWQKNCRILREQYHGKWHELLFDVELDAVDLVEKLEADGFNCLKGVKISPMYARIINDTVVSLDRLWELDVPVDTHIRRLSKELFEGEDEDLDDDDIRDRWYLYAVQNDISRHVVDAGLWQIGNNWDEWGEEYWQSL